MTGFFVVVEAPLKVTLFGEHAVVYNKPAIAATIPRFVRVGMRFAGGDSVKVISAFSPQIGLKLVELGRDRKVVRLDIDEEAVAKLFRYVMKGIELCEEFERTSRRGYEIRIESSTPPGAGLGTSAAISVATVAACIALHEELETLDGRLDDIARIAWSVEKEVQGAASPMDTFTVTYGGIRLIKPWIPEAEPLDVGDIPVIVGYIAKKMTTAELVARVRSLKTLFPAITEGILNTIESLVYEALNRLKERDMKSLGVLMNINHELLSALGVSTPELDQIVNALRSAGALGAKLSGAGGGGAFVAIPHSVEGASVLKSVIKAFGGEIAAESFSHRGVALIHRGQTEVPL